MTNSSARATHFLLALFVVLLDRWTKRLVAAHIAMYTHIQVIPGFFRITHTENTGAAFSMLADAAGWQRWVFVVLALAVSVTLIGWLRRLAAATQGLIACGLALIVGGALGNMIDRLRLGHVIDFIYPHWGVHYFPAFNAADSAITVGAGLLLLDAWLEAGGHGKGSA